MAGIRSFNVGKAATPGNTFHKTFSSTRERRFRDLWIYYIVKM